ncbi:MAG TPA: malto-oligosyltrehalose trehalohydrolase [Candidatus Acidoferrales bacterium]|nr:malto-oligosyltrehalose trehalohydrolase [Candidatus Acidoferrales bacterium]
MLASELRLGANLLSDGSCSFLVWSPHSSAVTLDIHPPAPAQMEMSAFEKGYFHCNLPGLAPGSLYSYILNNEKKRPDPASKSQPQGVHGPSQVCSDSFPWSDSAWQGLPLRENVFYELHVGTFTPEGAFDAIIPRLADLKSLGVTTIELMPVAQFPGERNWGYDGVYPFAVQNSYGGREGLKRLVNACHQAGMAVALDVVYNHLGPEGNYLNDFGPYFTDIYKTPWGQAVNFDRAYSDEVRRFFIENALYWFSEFHIDTLRLDAIHAIVDLSAKRFLEEMAERVDALSLQLKRKFNLVAENDRNDARVVLARQFGGLGFASQWDDDFHHSIHAILTGERQGYYGDFGSIHDVATACREGFVYSGQYSQFRRRRQGTSCTETSPQHFVVFIQNHDQVGNRAKGERLSQLVCFESLKLAAGIVLLSPFVPLLFMGEEYGETAPFQYFVSHGDEELVENVRRGRRREFEKFEWQPDVPDSQSPETFLRSKLHWELREQGHHQKLKFFYTNLLKIRKISPSLRLAAKEESRIVVSEPGALVVERWHERDRTAVFFNFQDSAASLSSSLAPGAWKKEFESCSDKWNGPGELAPALLQGSNRLNLKLQRRSFALFRLGEGGAG